MPDTQTRNRQITETQILDLTEELAGTKDRRRKSRLLISAPVRVRGAAPHDRNSVESTTTLNFSPAGILIETPNSSYYENMKVAVVLPYDESASDTQPEHEGTVVRVNELRNGRRTIAIALHSEVCDEHVSEIRDKHQRPADKSTGDRPAAQTIKSETKPTLPLVVVLAEEHAARESMKTYLSAEGYEVLTTSKVLEARTMLSSCTPALIIAEIEGEGMPGYDLCAYCKQTPQLKAIPVLLMTSSAYPSDYAKAHAVGAVVCMAKPYRRERLGHVVRLLAPSPYADKNAAPVRVADKSRRTPSARPRTTSPVTVR